MCSPSPRLSQLAGASAETLRAAVPSLTTTAASAVVRAAREALDRQVEDLMDEAAMLLPAAALAGDAVHLTEDEPIATGTALTGNP